MWQPGNRRAVCAALFPVAELVTCDDWSDCTCLQAEVGQLQGQLQSEVKRLQGQLQQARAEEEEAQEQRHALKIQLSKVSSTCDMPLLNNPLSCVNCLLPQHAVGRTLTAESSCFAKNATVFSA